MSSSSPLPEPSRNVVVDTASLPPSSTASVWDRISKWVSENKALVYTVAGVAVVVTSAGVVYYLSDSSRSGKPAPATAAPTEKKKKKSGSQRRKEKKAEEERKSKAASVQDGVCILD
jgi:import receptor subunit TOM70